MNEKLTLNLGGDKRLEMTRENSTLYTFMGQTAIGDVELDSSVVNHVFVRTSPPEASQASGMYFFREFDEKNYDTMTRHMTEHQFPMILNMVTVPECDLKVWLNKAESVVSNFADTIPDEL